MALPQIKFDVVSCVVNKTTLSRVSQYYIHKKHALNKCEEMKQKEPNKNYVVWTYNLSWPDNESMP